MDNSHGGAGGENNDGMKACQQVRQRKRLESPREQSDRKRTDTLGERQ